ncbi:Trypsin [Popillia japonica]|uniref:Trypsin n=1 Tax=Popillia japonica TaxID=7064 RepID=A0AAW1LSX6_POPJA
MKLFALTFAALCVCAYGSPTPAHFPAFQSGLERIVGGSNAGRDQFPHQISFQWGILGIFQHICGGSIISANRVLTAAHCITESPPIGSFRVRAGLLLIDENVASMQTVNIASHVIHPEYAGGVNPHDIAVLRLASALTLSASVSPIGLPVAGAQPSGNAILSGWGATNAAGNAMPNHLQTVTKPIITLAECSNALTALLGSAGPLDPTNVCTGPLTGGVSACSGDSGGPLIQGGVQVGIVSWGIMPCGTVGAPSVYVGVSNYIPFINNV